MDAYLPEDNNSTNRPVLLFIHGGCFNAGTKESISYYAKSFADEGFAVFSLDYRLADEAVYPAAITDLQQAVRFIRKNADYYKINPNLIIAHGESAGGYLAAYLGTREIPDRNGINDIYSKPVAYVSDWEGRTDFTLTQSTGIDCAEIFLGKQRNDLTNELFKSASLTTYISNSSANFILIHGTNDQQVNIAHSTILANALTANNIKNEIIYFENADHDFDIYYPWQITHNRIMNFLNREDIKAFNFLSEENITLKINNNLNSSFNFNFIQNNNLSIPLILNGDNNFFKNNEIILNLKRISGDPIKNFEFHFNNTLDQNKIEIEK